MKSIKTKFKIISSILIILSLTCFSYAQEISICSFNIKFVGNYKNKQNEALSDILKDYQVVVVQELVAPPIAGIYPDGTPYFADTEAKAFTDAMTSKGFKLLLSDEDTGTNDKIHTSGSSTEWFILFYKPELITSSTDLKSQFIADDRSNNEKFERVPYAFSLKTVDGKLDFVLISVHLNAGNDTTARARRRVELNTISKWIHDNDAVEKDFIILGDMNIYNPSELGDIIPDEFISLNDECVKTTTSNKNKYCYDHVMFRPVYTTEIDKEYDFKTINLIDVMEQYWDKNNGKYPGRPYDQHKFPELYSDHFPVVFKMNVPDVDDDFF